MILYMSLQEFTKTNKKREGTEHQRGTGMKMQW